LLMLLDFGQESRPLSKGGWVRRQRTSSSSVDFRVF